MSIQSLLYNYLNTVDRDCFTFMSLDNCKEYVLLNELGKPVETLDETYGLLYKHQGKVHVTIRYNEKVGRDNQIYIYHSKILKSKELKQTTDLPWVVQEVKEDK